MAAGVHPDLAVRSALIEPLSDDDDVKAALADVINAAWS